MARRFPLARLLVREETKRRNLLRELRSRGVTDGLLGGSRRWQVIGAIAWIIHLTRKRPEVVYRTRLQPGESLSIGVKPPRR